MPASCPSATVLKAYPYSGEELSEVERLAEVEGTVMAVAKIEVRRTPGRNRNPYAALDQGPCLRLGRQCQFPDTELRQDCRRDVTNARVGDSPFDIDDAATPRDVRSYGGTAKEILRAGNKRDAPIAALQTPWNAGYSRQAAAES